MNLLDRIIKLAEQYSIGTIADSITEHPDVFKEDEDLPIAVGPGGELPWTGWHPKDATSTYRRMVSKGVPDKPVVSVDEPATKDEMKHLMVNTLNSQLHTLTKDYFDILSDFKSMPSFQEQLGGLTSDVTIFASQYQQILQIIDKYTDVNTASSSLSGLGLSKISSDEIASLIGTYLAFPPGGGKYTREKILQTIHRYGKNHLNYRRNDLAREINRVKSYSFSKKRDEMVEIVKHLLRYQPLKVIQANHPELKQIQDAEPAV